MWRQKGDSGRDDQRGQGEEVVVISGWSIGRECGEDSRKAAKDAD